MAENIKKREVFRKKMRKPLLLMAILFAGCVSINVRENFVRQDLQNAYLSSVGIAGKKHRVFGSGVIVYHKTGHNIIVLTAYHVVDNESELYISVPTEIAHKRAKVEYYDKKRDLALISTIDVAGSDGPFVRLSKYLPYLGDDVWVIGSPLGDEGTITKGVLGKRDYKSGIELYRADASSFFGNSGGGMFDVRGDLVGIAHAIQMHDQIFAKTVIPGAFYFISLQEIRTFLNNR